MGVGDGQESDKTLAERAHERIDVRAEIGRLETLLEQLRIDYEQHFLGLVPQPPTSLHREFKRLIRRLQKAPFKNSQLNYALRAVESRFQTYNNYWTRVERQREEGTYVRDIFKANLRERIAQEEAEARTLKGKAKTSMQQLFDSYRGALEKETGKVQKIDFERFQKSLIQKAKSYQEKTGSKRLTFKVVVKDGKVTVQAKPKNGKT